MTAGFDELQAEIKKEIRQQRNTTIEELGGRALALRLAAPPLWTRTAAVDAGFLEEPERVGEFVQQACDVGWCERWGSLSADGPTELTFWMPDAVRRGVLDTLLAGDGGLSAVQDEARQVAASVIRCPDDVVPGELRAWADLCMIPAHEIPGALVERVKQAIARGDVTAAQELASAGEALEPMVEGGALSEMGRVRRMLEREQRKSQDEFALGRYLERQELSDGVARLLAPNAAQWALHLRGVGGVGKTMFIRYLASGRFAKRQGLPPIPIVRVDFDHMPADYPVTKPVQLLLELADELALDTAFNVRADAALENFRYNAEWANQAASSLREPSPRLLESEADKQVIDAFADAVSELGGALLILDTCEELAKWSGGSPDTPAIRRTLDIVKRLHDRAPSVRVLIAGRRPLPPQEWLAVQDVPGFTVEEARQYLHKFADQPLGDDLVNEMIRQSSAIDEPPPGPGLLPGHVNPFDLALYRAWADREPGLSPADITGGNDAYIESRIIERLRDDPLVTPSLPMLAVGGKCRVETIAEVLGCDPADLGRRLGTQEWIEAKGGSLPVFVAAQPALALRLRRYYETAAHREQLRRETRRFAEVLLRRLRDALLAAGDTPAAEVDADEVVTALRLADPAEAIRLWESVEAWAQEPPGRWHTVGKVTSRILGEWAEGEHASPDALRAAIQAANIAAYRREVPLADVREPWREVLAFAGRHPEPERQLELRLLGALGLLPYMPQDEALWKVLVAGLEAPVTSSRVFTAAVDATHRLLEAANASAARRLSSLLDLGRLAGAADLSRALAWARTAEARLLADIDPTAARGEIREAERLASAGTGPEPAWPYWVPPDDLLARVRIEWGLIDREFIVRPSSRAELETVLNAKLGPWERYATRYLDSSGHPDPSVDRERLASLCLRIRLRHGVVPASAAQRWESADSYVRGRVATNSAHDLIPPLFVSVAEAWLSAGRPERALALLEGRRSAANRTREDDATVRHANAAIVSVLRRLHLGKYQPSLLTDLTNPAGYRKSEAAKAWIGLLDDAWRAWAVIHREPRPGVRADTGRLAGWHAWWQCQPADARDPLPRLPWAPDGRRDDDDIPGLADVQADLREMELLGGPELEHELAQVRGQLDERLLLVPHRLRTTVRSPDPYHDLRLDLRWGALGEATWTPGTSAPVRLKAEMAFDEAELLALRLPAAAASLYLVAADAYRTCGDSIGRLLALAGFHDALSGCRESDRSELQERAKGPMVHPGTLADARRAVGTGNPPLAGPPAGTPEGADPWRYWAQTVQRVTGDLPETDEASAVPSTAPSKAPASPLITGAASAVTTVLRVLLGVLAVPLAVLLGGGARTAFRLAAERGVGVARPELLLFDAAAGPAIDAASADAVRLLVRPRPWRSALLPGTRSRLRLRAIILAVRLLQFGWPGRSAGYRGFLAATTEDDRPASVAWTPQLDAPGGAWWRQPQQGTADGTIRTDPDQAAKPWERILATCLGPGAAGRIEWIRLGTDQAGPAPSGACRGAELIAPPAWERLLGEHYRRPVPSADLSGNLPVRVRHVIGRAVKASAGPCMDVRGTAQPARGGTLLTVTELARGHPLVVVLEAEPVGGEDVGSARSDDLADKLRLAAALIEDGVPAVLVLPPLPVSCVHEVTRTVARFADEPGLSGGSIRVALLRPLRQIIARHIEHAVLDDITLFLNGRHS